MFVRWDLILVKKYTRCLVGSTREDSRGNHLLFHNAIGVELN
jgi:hypothetical protein